MPTTEAQARTAARAYDRGENWFKAAGEAGILDKNGRPDPRQAARHGKPFLSTSERTIHAPAPGPGPTVRVLPPPREPDKADQEAIHAYVLTAAKLLLLLVEEAVRPTERELNDVLKPAERIILRRVSVSAALSPDIQDIMAIIIGGTSYALRIAGESDQRRAARTRAPVAASRPASGGPYVAQRPAAPVASSPASDGSGNLDGFDATSMLRDLHSRAFTPDAGRAGDVPADDNGYASQAGG